MIDKERLEEIEKRLSVLFFKLSRTNGKAQLLNDLQWLIEQAERVEELETQLQKENERYKQALEEIRGLYPLRNVGYQVSEIRKIVIRALEESE